MGTKASRFFHLISVPVYQPFQASFEWIIRIFLHLYSKCINLHEKTNKQTPKTGHEFGPLVNLQASLLAMGSSVLTFKKKHSTSHKINLKKVLKIAYHPHFVVHFSGSIFQF